MRIGGFSGVAVVAVREDSVRGNALIRNSTTDKNFFIFNTDLPFDNKDKRPLR
jgi:hypothetical protein